MKILHENTLLLLTLSLTIIGERMETIQAPLLHIISHCMELACKSVINDAIGAAIIKASVEKTIIHDHTLLNFLAHIKKILKSVTKQMNKEEKVYFTNFQQSIQRLFGILQTNTTSYRYSHSIDKEGNCKDKSLPFNEDSDSPNIGEVKILFNDCHMALSAISSIISTLYPQEILL